MSEKRDNDTPERSEEKKLICRLCDIELVLTKVEFSYLGHVFATDLLRCPGCGQVFIPEKLVKGRMAEVEMELEDK